MVRTLAILALALAAPVAAAAAPLSGAKVVALVDGEGARVEVADIVFTPDGDDAVYQVTWRDGPFEDHFLSMRPFKCLEGADKHWCRVPYPYENRRRVTDDDLTDLEYDLLFLWKGANEYGINMWNGVYYRLARDGAGLTGALHEMDMDILSAPPDEGDLRPVRPVDIEESDPESHWLPRLVIE